jgi:phytoene synthase
VASAVGLASLRIFGVPTPHGVRYAEELGVALQLTNIIRDVGPDSGNGRIYLPIEDLRAFGVREESVMERESSPAFLRLMEFQTRRAREHFSRAKSMRPGDFSEALRPADLMTEVYETLLRKIERKGFPLGLKPVKLGRIQKVWLLAKSAIRAGG